MQQHWFDYLFYHIHTFIIHVTVLTQGVLFGRSSHLITDEANLGFLSFAMDQRMYMMNRRGVIFSYCSFTQKLHFHVVAPMHNCAWSTGDVLALL